MLVAGPGFRGVPHNDGRHLLAAGRSCLTSGTRCSTPSQVHTYRIAERLLLTAVLAGGRALRIHAKMYGD